MAGLRRPARGEIRTGREARSEFGESLEPEAADQETLGSSILFTSRRHPEPMPFRPPRWARKITKEHLRLRRIGSWEYGYWWIEWGGNKDTIRGNELIRFELLSIVMDVWDYIKNSGEHPDSANWALDWAGMMPGKRGSRRVVGGQAAGTAAAMCLAAGITPRQLAADPKRVASLQQALLRDDQTIKGVSYRREAEGRLIGLVSVSDNYQRLRRHRFEAVTARAIRIHVKATQGDEAARIFEVRCYR